MQSVPLVVMEWTVLEPVPLNTTDGCAKASVNVRQNNVTENMDACHLKQKVRLKYQSMENLIWNKYLNTDTILIDGL